MGEKMTLPEGWSIEDSEEAHKEKPSNSLPPGWKVDESTPQERDMEKFRNISGPYLARELSREELNNLSLDELVSYRDELNRNIDYVNSNEMAKGVLSGATFGFTENFDALKTAQYETESNPAAAFGELVGSTIPLSGMTNIVSKPVAKLAGKSPVLQKQIGSLLTMFGVGSLDGATKTLVKGDLPSIDQVWEHGKDWAILDVVLSAAGVLGKFAKSFLTKAEKSGVPKTELMNKVIESVDFKGSPQEISEKAFEILSQTPDNAELAAQRLQGAKKELTIAQKAANEAIKKETVVTPKDLSERKITNKSLQRLDQTADLLAEKFEPGQVDLRKEMSALEKEGVQAQLDAQSTRAATKEELGTSIREDINARRKTEKEAYSPLYKEAEEGAQYITHHADSTASTAFKTLQNLETHTTNPEGYSKVIKTLKGIIKDAGYEIKRTSKGQQILTKSKQPVSVKHTMELAKRIHKVIKYDELEYQVQDKLRDVVAASKRDVREGLAGNEDLLKAYNTAESEHARVANKYGTKTIQKIRKTEAGESIAKTINDPTVLENLQQTMSPKGYAQVEREVLEGLQEKDYLSAGKQLREVNKYLSKENQKLAKEIVEAKNPNNPMARKKAVKEAIFNDVSNALTDGSRPQKTLSLWKTRKGQKIVREAFKNSPNGPDVIKYLENQSFNDMVQSVMKDGVIDFKAVERFVKDPAMRENILNIGGEEAVNFLEKMDGRVKQFQENAKLLEKFPPTKNSKAWNDFKESQEGKTIRGRKILERMSRKDYPIQNKINDFTSWLKESMGLNAQAAMNVFGIAKLSSPVVGAFTVGLPTTISAMVGYKIMTKLLTSPNVRRKFIKAASKGHDPVSFAILLSQFGQSIDE
jgi:hypothetical protein